MAHPNYRTIEKWLESQGIREMIDESLPDGISTDAWINSALTHIGSDKDLLEADPQSTLGSILEASTLGVRFEGPLGEAYLEARSSKYKADDGTWQWRKLTQLQIQYRGLMKLARRDPLVRKVEAIIVHENDVFDHRLGSDPYLNHTWDVRKQRGKMVAVYAALRYHDGFYDFGQPYPMSAIYKHRDRILSDKNIRVERRDDGSEVFWKTWKEGKPEEAMADFQIRRIPWITYIEAMAQKTAVRWSAKFWDLSPEFDKAAALVSLAESSKGQSMVDVARNVVGSEVLDGPDSPSGGATDDARSRGVVSSEWARSRRGCLPRQVCRSTMPQARMNNAWNWTNQNWHVKMPMTRHKAANYPRRTKRRLWRWSRKKLGSLPDNRKSRSSKVASQKRKIHRKIPAVAAVTIRSCGTTA